MAACEFASRRKKEKQKRIRTGVRLILEPEAKPMTMQNAMVKPTIALLFIKWDVPSANTAAGSQRAKDEIMHMLSVIIIRL